MIQNSQKHISIVIPVYGVDQELNTLCSRLTTTLNKITPNFEIILVNDASPDKAWHYITNNHQKDNRIIGLNLSRNFGQYEAITAGLNYSTGEWVVIMDCDLQDRPEEIANLYNKAQEGFDLVFGLRQHRKANVLRKLVSNLFSITLTKLTGVKQDTRISHFGIYSKKVIDAVLTMKDQNRYFQTMVRWVGFHESYIEVQHNERVSGKSSYTFSKLFSLALQTILSFSDKPLLIMVKLGAITSLISFLYAFATFIQAYLGLIEVSGWASLMISVWFLSGIHILFLGIVGIYIGRVFAQVKDRPVFIVKETTNGS